MSRRNYWTIYDDETMEYEADELDEELESISLNEMMFDAISIIKKQRIEREIKNKDHFEQEDDLFEM